MDVGEGAFEEASSAAKGQPVCRAINDLLDRHGHEEPKPFDAVEGSDGVDCTEGVTRAASALEPDLSAVQSPIDIHLFPTRTLTITFNQ